MFISTGEDLSIDNQVSFYGFKNTEYLVIDLSYKNNSNKKINLWVQNWKIKINKDSDSSVFGNCPYSLNGGLLNALVFINNKKDAFYNKKFVFDQVENDTLLNCSYIKPLKPNECFNVKIICKDDSLIRLLKNSSNDFFILLYYSYMIDNKSNYSNTKNRIFYADSNLYLLYDRLDDDCIPKNVTSLGGIIDKNSYQTIKSGEFISSRKALFISRASN